MPLLYRTFEGRSSEPGRKTEYIEITGYEGEVATLMIPETIDGLEVKKIASSAFRGHKELTKIVLPKTVKTLGAFAFYGCLSLTEISLYDTLDDYYDGVIRNCPSLKLITVTGRGDNYVIVREMLRDVDVRLRFRLIMPDSEVRLTFPEYVNEAREDTMARAIHFTIEGAGLAYRECVSKKSIDLAGYDRLLPRLTDYDLRAGVDISLDRLMYPEGLSAAAGEMYREFLAERSEKVLEYLIEENDTERIAFLCAEDLISDEGFEPGIRKAAEDERTQICGILMEYRNNKRKSEASETEAAGLLSLDDF